jgi:hypothetical protein
VRDAAGWRRLVVRDMKTLKRLFTVKTKFEAFLVIYALALGATERGLVYIETFPGFGGKLLALCCTGAVFMAGGKMLDAVEMHQQFDC